MFIQKIKNIILAGILIMTMCIPTFAVSAQETSILDSDSTSNILYDKEEGMYYFDFTIPESISTLDASSDWLQSYYENVTAITNYEITGDEMYSPYSYLTAVVRGDTSGVTVAVQLRVKGLLNQYYKVSNGYKTFVCDGETHTLFAGFSVEAGKTYRFYYESLGSKDIYPTLTMSAVFWE